ncbi:MAG: hypothetical protein AMXMBFR16_11470 [Candidatus Uhrbacteria bacterium]
MADCNEPREYFDRIDFTRTVHNWPARGMLHTYIEDVGIVNLIARLLKGGVLAAFGVKVNVVCIPTSVCVELRCQSAIGDKVDAALTKALSIMDEMGLTIYWTEGDFSYRIDCDGRIIDKCQMEGGG